MNVKFDDKEPENEIPEQVKIFADMQVRDRSASARKYRF